MTVETVLNDYLRPYQRRWIEDRARRKIVLKSRRVGFSEAACIESLLEALGTPHRNVYLCSLSLSDAKELLKGVAKWLTVFDKAGLNLPVKAVKKTAIEFDNGSRILAIPAKNVRGKTGTIVLDEFAFYTHDREVWKAVAPAIESSSSLRLIIISTPFGASGVFWEIWTDPDGEYGNWSRHRIDVYDAASEGFPVDPERLKQRYPRDIWLQEFCCEFTSDIDQYFTHELIRRCLYNPSDDTQPEGTHYAGIDLASEQDASCLAELTDTDETFHVRQVRTIKPAGESRDYTDQFDDVDQILAQGDFDHVAVDATGEGAQLGQDLRRKYGSRTVTEVRSGDWRKVYESVPRMRLAMERGELRIPNVPAIRHAFTKIQRKESTSRKVKFEALRDAQGHADEFYATLLAFHAADERRRQKTTTTKTEQVGSLPRRSGSLGPW